MIIILTGPPAAGKNTIARELVALQKRVAVIDVDVLRHMAHPHLAPWCGEEGRFQHELGVQNACSLANNFDEKGFDAVILDVIDDGLAKIYRTALNPKVSIVALLPSFEEVVSRNKARPPVLSDAEIKFLYEQQTQLKIFDTKLDNTLLSPVQTAQLLLSKWNKNLS